LQIAGVDIQPVAGENGNIAACGCKSKNLFVVSVILITGIGGLSVSFGEVTITSIACALILGILTNLMLSKEKDQ
jgi:xanthine/uracil permease